MPWIETTPSPAPDPTLAAVLEEALRGYPPEYAPTSPAHAHLPEAVREDSIVLSHARIPGAMRHIFAGYAAMLDPALPLSRREHELIAATVSALNRCFY